MLGVLTAIKIECKSEICPLGVCTLRWGQLVKRSNRGLQVCILLNLMILSLLMMEHC
jgi:hypothetical protein